MSALCDLSNSHVFNFEVLRFSDDSMTLKVGVILYELRQFSLAKHLQFYQKKKLNHQF